MRHLDGLIRFIGAVALIAMASFEAQATGLLLPSDKDLPPLAIRYHRVETEIESQVATTTVRQEFMNTTDRQLEATYVFPIPSGATVRSFSMWMNGKKVEGDLVEKDEAQRIYEEIVRRMRDPGLLEYWEGRLLRMRVFPVPAKGDVRVEVELQQLLSAEDGVVEYLYPLRTGEKASATIEDFTFSVRIRSETPIRNVFSPTHEIAVDRPSEQEAVVGFELDEALLDRDFRLLYDVSTRDIGVSLVAYRRAGEEGTFLLLASPKQELQEKDILPKDVVFVLDVSGSMKGAKIEQARETLVSCIGRLPDRDRFEVIRFSTAVEPVFRELRPAAADNTAEALEFVKATEARGGTAINGALETAFSTPGFGQDGGRPLFVVFLTDGKPTVGETEPSRIVENVQEWNKARGGKARLFVFGVGDRVNTHLLDRLSGQSGGISTYVSEDQEIDREVKALFQRLNRPVLANLELGIGPVEVTEVYPPDLPDLFGGSQLTVVGRYRTAGDAAVTLKGKVHDEEKTFVYEVTFPEEALGNAFIEEIWATRKVGYLLDQIRLNGEDPELKEEVTRLGREFGIVTPYTSYLVLESSDRERYLGDETLETAWNASAETFGGYAGGRYARSKAGAVDRAAEALGESDRRVRGRVMLRDFDGGGMPAGERADMLRTNLYAARPEAAGLAARAPASVAQELKVLDERAQSNFIVESGGYANTLSGAIQTYRESEQVQNRRRVAVRNVAGRAFYLADGFWNDETQTPDMPEVRVRFASRGYFELLRVAPSLRPILAVGANMALVQNGQVVRVSDAEGLETLNDEQLKALADAE